MRSRKLKKVFVLNKYILLSDSPVSARLAVVDVSFPSFVFHSAEHAEREKAWAVRLFKNYRCPWKNASLPASLRVRARVYMYVDVGYTPRRSSPATDERPNNKRQQENAEPRSRLENQIGPLSRHVLH